MFRNTLMVGGFGLNIQFFLIWVANMGVNIVIGEIKPRKEVMTLKRQGLTQFPASNEGEAESKLILQITIIYPQNRR